MNALMAVRPKNKFCVSGYPSDPGFFHENPDPKVFFFILYKFKPVIYQYLTENCKAKKII